MNVPTSQKQQYLSFHLVNQAVLVASLLNSSLQQVSAKVRADGARTREVARRRVWDACVVT